MHAFAKNLLAFLRKIHGERDNTQRHYRGSGANRPSIPRETYTGIGALDESFRRIPVEKDAAYFQGELLKIVHSRPNPSLFTKEQNEDYHAAIRLAHECIDVMSMRESGLHSLEQTLTAFKRQRRHDFPVEYARGMNGAFLLLTGRCILDAQDFDNMTRKYSNVQIPPMSAKEFNGEPQSVTARAHFMPADPYSAAGIDIEDDDDEDEE